MIATWIFAEIPKIVDSSAAGLAIRSVVLLVAAIALSAFVANRSAGLRSLAWRLTLIALLLLGPASALLPSLDVAVGDSIATRVLVPRTQRVETGGTVRSRMTRNAEGRDRNDPGSSAGHVSFPLFVSVWILGTILTLARIAAGRLRVRALSCRAADVTSAIILGELERIAAGRGLDRIRVLESPELEIPAAWGVVRPTLLLPPEMESWDGSRRRRVLTHEVSHLRRHDPLHALLGELTVALYWWNPLVWFAASRSRDESEKACDDLVLAAGSRPSDYAEDLVSLARGIRVRGAAAISGGRLGKRIDALFRDRDRGEPGTVAAAGIIIAAGLLVWLAGTTALVARDFRSDRPPRFNFSTASGLPWWEPGQFRWSYPGRAGGMFVEGSLDLGQLLRGEPFIGHDGLIVSFERHADGHLSTFAAWDDHGGVGLSSDGGGTESLRSLVKWLAPDWRDHPDTFIGAVASDPVVAGQAPVESSGSVILGVPGSSRNPNTGTIEAGWYDGQDRIGVFARGPITLNESRTSVAHLAPDAWLAAIAWNRETRLLETIEIVPDAGGTPEVETRENGRIRPSDPRLLQRILAGLPKSSGEGSRDLRWASR